MNRREALGLLAGAPVAVAAGAVAASAAPAVGGLLHAGEAVLTRAGAERAGDVAALNRGDAGPQEHPLATALGAGWLWLRRPDHATTVLVHDTGLWTELDDTGLWTASAEAVEQTAASLRDGLARGLTGRVFWWSTGLGPGVRGYRLEPSSAVARSTVTP